MVTFVIVKLLYLVLALSAQFGDGAALMKTRLVPTWVGLTAVGWGLVCLLLLIVGVGAPAVVVLVSERPTAPTHATSTTSARDDITSMHLVVMHVPFGSGHFGPARVPHPRESGLKTISYVHRGDAV